MTNEEKAREIEAFFETPNPKDARFIMCYQSALKMAEWKDKQFKEYLKKKKDESMAWIERQAFYGNDAYRIKENEERIGFIDEIINELFKEN